MTNVPELGERLEWLANTTGPTLSPFDSWLFIRSLKTLPLRVDRQEETAFKVVTALREHSAVKDVLFAGKGSMISIRLQSEAAVGPFLEALELFTYAESLGGVESLVTHPASRTHTEVSKETREKLGITDTLLRLSVGIENIEDLLNDIKQALE